MEIIQVKRIIIQVFFYYEEYSNGMYGIYAIGLPVNSKMKEEGNEAVLINTLKNSETLPVNGYGVMYHSSVESFEWQVTEQYRVSDNLVESNNTKITDALRTSNLFYDADNEDVDSEKYTEMIGNITNENDYYYFMKVRDTAVEADSFTVQISAKNKFVTFTLTNETVQSARPRSH